MLANYLLNALHEMNLEHKCLLFILNISSFLSFSRKCMLEIITDKTIIRYEPEPKKNRFNFGTVMENSFSVRSLGIW